MAMDQEVADAIANLKGRNTVAKLVTAAGNHITDSVAHLSEEQVLRLAACASRATELQVLGHTAQAVYWWKEAQKADPERFSILMNLAGCLVDLGEYTKAMGLYEIVTAKALPPVFHAEANHGKAICYLKQGLFSEGFAWETYRMQRQDAKVGYAMYRPIPTWDCETSPQGKSVLVWMEQGVGDEIMQATMLPDLLRDARLVGLVTHPKTHEVFRRAFPGVHMYERKGEAGMRIDIAMDPNVPTGYDFQMSFTDLGMLYRPNLGSFNKARDAHMSGVPRREVYEVLRSRYLNHGKFVIGLCYKSSAPERAHIKSAALSDFEPLKILAQNAVLVDLNYVDIKPREAFIPSMPTFIHDPAVDSFNDIQMAFDQVAACDMVITTSGTVAHIAGSIGKPVYLMLSRGYGEFWYWMHHGDDSKAIFYPDIRRFWRINAKEEWKPVVNAIAHDIRSNLVGG